MKLRPKFFAYNIKKVKLKILKKFRKLDFEGYYSAYTLKLENLGVTGYEPCYNFSKLLKICKITNKDSFIDIGSGKGCALYYARKFPFSLIDGVELSKDLADISIKNIEKLKDNRLHVYNADARTFSKYENYNYFYMYNPCNEEVMNMISTIILNSYETNKRDITIIYQTPKHKDIFLKKGFKLLYSGKKGVVMRLYKN